MGGFSELKNERFIGVERCYSAHREGAKTFLPVQARAGRLRRVVCGWLTLEMIPKGIKQGAQ